MIRQFSRRARARRPLCALALASSMGLFVACDGGRQAASGPEVRAEEPPVSVVTSPRSRLCAPDNRGWEDFPALVGSMHQHSGFSDGEIGTTPADYFAAGRELGLDFVAAAEHSDNLRLPLTVNGDCFSAQLPQCLQLPTLQDPLGGILKWERMAELADAATDADFTAIRGFEWTSDRFGHMNVFFSRNEINAKTTDGYVLSMEGFWLWFGLSPDLGGGNDGLLVFNHPGREDLIHSNIPDPGFTFNDFALRPNAAPRVVGIEVFGKSGDAYDIDNGAPPEGWYAYALDKGWALGPVGAEDEHGTRWAQPERAKTVILAPSRARDDLRQALQDRRFYALAQNFNDIRLHFSADGEPMGSAIARPDGAAVVLRAAVTAPDNAQLEIVSNGGEVVATGAASAVLEHRISADPTERWYYLRVIVDEQQPVAYSAPVWVVAGDPYPACAATQ
ncbi:MAG: hypothetical protein ABF296_05705 [Oceanococcaceae bacterium]